MGTLRDLAKDVDEREERGLIIDSDGLVYLSAYRYKKTDNPELVYYDFCKRVYAIEREVYSKYIITDTVLAITSKTNFRYRLYPEYKANRSNKDDKAERLSQLVKSTKRLIAERLKPIVKVSVELEADDWAITYANEENYIVSAMDSDIVTQCPTPVFNFHKNHRKFVHQGLAEKEIFLNVIRDSIKGKSKDNVKGCIGKGEVFANKFIERNDITFTGWIDLFDTPADALLSFQLCDCRQYKNGKLELATIPSIDEEFTEHCCPF